MPKPTVHNIPKPEITQRRPPAKKVGASARPASNRVDSMSAMLHDSSAIADRNRGGMTVKIIACLFVSVVIDFTRPMCKCAAGAYGTCKGTRACGLGR